MDKVSRRVMQLVEEFSDANADARRTELKEAQAQSEAKMEISRRASVVSLQTQQAALEAAQAVALAKQAERIQAALTDGADECAKQLLEEANSTINDLQRKLEVQQRRAQRAEEAQETAQNMATQHQAAAEAADEQAAKMSAELAELSESFREAKAGSAASAEEAASLLQRAETAELAADAAEAARAALAAESALLHAKLTALVEELDQAKKEFSAERQKLIQKLKEATDRNSLNVDTFEPPPTEALSRPFRPSTRMQCKGYAPPSHLTSQSWKPPTRARRMTPCRARGRPYGSNGNCRARCRARSGTHDGRGSHFRAECVQGCARSTRDRARRMPTGTRQL